MVSNLREFLKPIQEVVDYDKLREEYEGKPLTSIIFEIRGKYAKRSGSFTFSVRNVNGKRFYFIRTYDNEYFWPNYLSAYFYCAKNLWLRYKLKATVIGERGLRSIARGLRIHDLYAEYLRRRGLKVETEVHVHETYYDVEVDGYADFVVSLESSRSVISKRLANELGAFTPLRKPYELRTASKGGKLRVIGYCNVDVVFEGVEVPGGTRFEVVENLREGIELIISRPNIDAWEIVFTPKGPRPKKTPIENSR